MADATGGTITYSGGKTIHTFTGSGTFVAPRANTVRVLIVAGGGGGGGSAYWNGYDGPGSGGGGGGEVKDLASVSIGAASHSIVVGGGGACEWGNLTAGGNSSAFGNTSTGGLPGRVNNGTWGEQYPGQGGASGNGYAGGTRNQSNVSGGGGGAGGD